MVSAHRLASVGCRFFQYAAASVCENSVLGHAVGVLLARLPLSAEDVPGLISGHTVSHIVGVFYYVPVLSCITVN